MKKSVRRKIVRITLVCFVTLVVVSFFSKKKDDRAEQRVFSTLENHFGTKVDFSKGSYPEIMEEDKKFIGIDLKGGEIINTVAEHKLATAAAVYLQTQLASREIDEYDKIGVKVYKKDSDTSESFQGTYGVDLLKDLAHKSINFHKAVSALEYKGATGLYELLKPEFQNEKEKNVFVSKIDKAIADRGGIDSIKLVAIDRIQVEKTKKRYLNFEGIIYLKDQTTAQLLVQTYYEPFKEGIVYIKVN
ncbi:MAG: hypothetical protein CMH46_10725 [Muricauda sp.]|nr:hypothetical protein [Allomuricauda sp.]